MMLICGLLLTTGMTLRWKEKMLMTKTTSFGIVSRGISSRWDAALKTWRILFITFFFPFFFLFCMSIILYRRWHQAAVTTVE